MTYRPTIRTQLRKNICFGAHTVIAGCFGAGNNRVHKREAQSYLVTGANCLHTVRLEDAEPDARCTAGHAAKAVPRQGQCVKSYEARCRSSSEWFPASSLVCFCITCQAFFSQQESQPARPALHASPAPHDRHHAPGRKRAPSRTCVRRSPARTPTHPAASLHQTATAPPAAKQVFHNLSTDFSTFSPVFHSGFLSPWLSLRETG